MRLSLKSVRLFVVLATLAGSLFAFSPDASAHKNTGSVAAVTGTVIWPQLPKEGDARSGVGFDLDDRGPANFGGTKLSLDRRAGTSSPLNGCRLEDGNSGRGLPVGHTGKVTPVPTQPELYTTHDLCFIFEGLTITSVGLWDGLNHKTDFDCAASGTTGASGNDKGPAANVPVTKLQGTDAPVSKPTFGAFYGEFTCNGSLVATGTDVQLPAVGTADGHFHGLSIGSTAIGFLGEALCTTPNPDDTSIVCPLANDANRTTSANGGHQTPTGLVLDDANNSRIKHTLACKGDVVPLLPPTPGVTRIIKYGDGSGNGNPVTATLGDTIERAQVVLECIIA